MFRRVAGDQILIDSSYRRLGYRRFDGCWRSTEHSHGDLVFGLVVGHFRPKNVLCRTDMRTHERTE